MKQYKVAVCISGEARTFKYALPSFSKFFESDFLDVKYFGHTWTNSFFNKDSRLNPDKNYHVTYDAHELKNELQSSLDFTDIKIENKDRFEYNLSTDFIFQKLESPFGVKQAANLKRPYVFDQMSYSIMMANGSKTVTNIIITHRTAFSNRLVSGLSP